MTCLKKVALALSFIALTIVSVNEILADEFKLIPSIAVRGEYNDNIFYTVDDTDDDFITTISAGLELIERTERLDLNLAALLSPFFYADYSDLDDADQNYMGRISYKINPSFGVNANALYDVSNRRDRDFETTGIVTTNDKRKRGEFGLGFDYTMTEKTGMAFSFDYLKDKWDSINIDRQDLEDYRALLNFTHNLSQFERPTIGRLNFGFERYKFEGEDIQTSDTYNYFGTVGVQHWFSETVNLLVDFGARYTDSDFVTPQLVFVPPSSTEIRIVEINNTGWGGTGQAILEKQGELTRGSIRIAYGILPASGRGTTVQRFDAVLNLRRRLAERSAIAIATGFYNNKADADEFSFRELDENTFFIRPTIRWEFLDKFTLDAGYIFNYVDDRVENDDRKRNVVYLQVAYGLPLFE
jgi:hypothetical protein